VWSKDSNGLKWRGLKFDGRSRFSCDVRQRELARGHDYFLSGARSDFVGATAAKPHAGNSLSARAFSS
jgi:hypothetical protein